MWIMNVVWPVTALYFGPVAIWAYFAMGRGSAKDAMDSERMKARKAAAARVDDEERSAELQTGKPYWKIVAGGVTHCGSGCTLGDIIAEFGIFFLVGGAVTGGAKLGLDYAADFTLAFVLGVAFQYFTLAPMRGISGWKGIVEATKVDALSLIVFGEPPRVRVVKPACSSQLQLISLRDRPLGTVARAFREQIIDEAASGSW